MNFSVLLSVYHKENSYYFKEAIDSIYNQTLLPSEVILVKDGPLTPELDKEIEKFQKLYKNLKVISLLENKGLGFALNEGIKHCSYEWIARMDTDDICFPDRFEKQIKAINENPDVSFIGTAIAEFNENPEDIVSYRRLPQNHEEVYKYAKSRCPLNHVSVMFKKKAVLDCGGYGEFPEDYHLWIRALFRGYRFYNHQEALVNVRLDYDAIKRRGGFSYAVKELKHQYEFYKIGFLSFPEFIKNSLVRFPVRIMPNSVRQIIYERGLREKKK